MVEAGSGGEWASVEGRADSEGCAASVSLELERADGKCSCLCLTVCLPLCHSRGLDGVLAHAQQLHLLADLDGTGLHAPGNDGAAAGN